MPSPRSSKAKPGKPGKPRPSPLDDEQRALLEKQRHVQEQIEALQRTIAEAPAHRDEQRRQGHAAYLAGPHGPRAHFRHQATIAGARYMESPSMASRPKKRPKPVVLRREKAEGRIQTVALLIALAGALFWLASRYWG